MAYQCDKCGKNFDSKPEAIKHERKCKIFDSKNYILEYKRKCKQCGKVWHSLVSREDEINKSLRNTGCGQFVSALGMCGGRWEALGSSAQYSRNADALKEELNRLRKCPKCNSIDYKEEILAHEKK